MQPNKSKATLQLVIATLLSLFGMLLLGAAFVTAPPGEIHSSVLIAYGEVMTFAGALFGIDYHYRRKSMSHASAPVSPTCHALTLAIPPAPPPLFRTHSPHPQHLTAILLHSSPPLFRGKVCTPPPKASSNPPVEIFCSKRRRRLILNILPRQHRVDNSVSSSVHSEEKA